MAKFLADLNCFPQMCLYVLYMYSLGIMIIFKSSSHPGLKRFDVMTLSDVAGQKLSSAGVVVDTFPLHNRKKLKDLREAWYSGNQLAQPLGGWKYNTLLLSLHAVLFIQIAVKILHYMHLSLLEGINIISHNRWLRGCAHTRYLCLTY